MGGSKHNNPFLAKLIALYLQAEVDIINELVRLRQQGLVDYHAEAALRRIQGILTKMQSESFVYIPQMIEREFYVHHPEARNIPEKAAKHEAGYYNALSIGQAAIIEQLAGNAQAEVWQAGRTVQQTLQHTLENVLVGRREPDAFAEIGRAVTAYNQVRGLNSLQTVGDFVAVLQQQGITAFVDKAGRRWSLHTYCSMVMRTTRRQAEIAAVLTVDPEQDLYKISSHSTTCPLCAPYEGRVYSRSGKDPDFPPLAAAFGKVDPNGPEDLSNTWLNIHPNCLHVLLPWTDAGMTEEEIAKIKDFSSFKTNPPDIDPRTEKQRQRYREQQQARRRELDTYKQWERYRLALGDKAPKRWETFARHKKADDAVYKKWQQEYRAANIAMANTTNILHYEQANDIIKEGLKSGQISAKINIGHQNKHILGKMPPDSTRSYIYGGIEEAQKLVNQYAGTGQIRRNKKGQWVNKEIVTADEYIGVYVDLDTGLKIPTNRFSIHYGKKGTHVVPADPTNEVF